MKRKARKRRGPRYWIVAIGTLGMLVAYCPRNSHNVILGKTRHEDAAAATQQQIAFDIPAGTLETVLSAFQKTTGLQVIIPNEAMRSLPSPGVKGRYSSEQALREILRDEQDHLNSLATALGIDTPDPGIAD